MLFEENLNRNGDTPAGNPHPDDHDLCFRDRAAARLGASRRREENADTVGTMRRESADRVDRCHGPAR
jgi:hypothetical protein